jgi:6-phosphogluconolactonase
MTRAEIQIFETVDSLQSAAARQIADELSPSTTGRVMHMALSGGSTPRRMHELLAETAGIDWSRVHIYWGDERTVPPDHPESNYRMTRETLLDRIDIPEGNIHRMRGEIDPDESAREYEELLQQTFGTTPPDVPRFDVVVLGVGSDGHTASLFPGTEALKERERWVVANEVPQQQTTRITLTYPVLNNADLVIFLAAGANKQDALKSVFSGGDEERPPAAFVQPAGRVIWFLDAEAGTALKS